MFLPSLSEAQPTSGLVAAYSFNEGSGTTVADLSGNNVTGTIVGATWSTSGKYGNALVFDGATSYVDLSNPTALQLTGSMTIEAWVNVSANPADAGEIVSKSNGIGWQLETTSSNTFGVGVSTSSSITKQYSAAAPSLGTWYHVAGVYDAVGTLNVYVDGVLTNGAVSGTVPVTQFDQPVSVNIGRLASGAFYFNGFIDEVRIYNRALTQAEIQTDRDTPLSASLPPDVTPPAISMSAPANGAPVSGTVVVSANASDNFGVAGVQFLLDGANLGPEVTTSPFSMQWDATTALLGYHSLSARARDFTGNTAISSNISVFNVMPSGGQITVDALITMNNISPAAPGTVITPTIMTNGTLGPIDGWTANGSVSALSVAAPKPVCSLNTPITVAGVAYSVPPPRQAITMSNTANSTYLNAFVDTTSKKSSVAACITFGGVPNTTNLIDMVSLYGSTGAYAVLQLQNGSCINVETDGGGTLHSGCITPVGPSPTYWCSMQANALTGIASLACFQPTYPFTQVGTTVTVRQKSGNNWGETFQLRLGNVEVGTAAATSYWENLMYDFTNGVFPLGVGALVDDTQPPTPPANLIATPLIGRANLSWTAASDNFEVAGYNVHRSTVAGFTPDATNQIGQSSTPAYADTSFAAAGTYYYRVIARDAKGNVSTPSNEAVANVVLDTGPPAAVTTLTATAVSTSRINLSWTAPADNVGVTGYNIYRNGTPLTTSTGTTFADTGLTALTPYSYMVTARDAVGNVSAAGNVATATTAASGTAAAAPQFSPSGGTYSSPRTVVLSSATAGATIYYTTDGSAPAAASIPYTAPIAVNVSTTIKAIAVAAGRPNSTVATVVYTLRAATPQFGAAAATFSVPQSITVTDSSPGATIYYTMNGSTPTAASTPYTGPIPVTVTTTIKAIAVVSGWSDSAVATVTYTLRAATPQFGLAPGTFGAPQSVGLSSATAGAIIYYTTNGNNPTTSSTRYAGPISVTSTTTIKAMAIATGWTKSGNASASYVIR